MKSKSYSSLCIALGLIFKNNDCSSFRKRMENAYGLLHFDKSLIIYILTYLDYKTVQKTVHIPNNNSIIFQYNNCKIISKLKKNIQFSNLLVEPNKLNIKTYCKKIKKQKNIQSLAVSMNSILALTNSGKLLRYIVQNGKLVFIDSLTIGIIHIKLSPNGKYLSMKTSKCLYILYFETCQIIKKFDIETETQIFHSIFSKDSSKLLLWTETFIFLYTIHGEFTELEIKDIIDCKYTNNGIICTIQSYNDSTDKITFLDENLSIVKTCYTNKNYRSTKWAVSADSTEIISAKKRKINIINTNNGTIKESITCKSKVNKCGFDKTDIVSYHNKRHKKELKYWK